MFKVAEQKELGYRDQVVTSALAILRSRRLAINASFGFWSITSEGFKHPKITTDQAREFATTWRARTGKTHL